LEFAHGETSSLKQYGLEEATSFGRDKREDEDGEKMKRWDVSCLWALHCLLHKGKSNLFSIPQHNRAANAEFPSIGNSIV